MLVDTLKKISNMKVSSKKLLAINLNTTESMVDQLLDQLKRMGYIAEEKPTTFCNGKCACCNVNCSLNSANTLFITNKGKKLLNSKQ